MRIAVVLALTALSCGTPVVPLELSKSWPSDPPALEVATKTWTRTAEKRGGLDTDVELIVSVSATYRSPQWRAALIEHTRKRGQLSAADVDTLKGEQKEAAAKHHEFALLIATHDRRLNDFAKGDRSSWQIRLRDAKGAEVKATRVYKDRRPPAEIAAELPHLHAFHEAYVAEFPPEIELLGEGRERFSVRVFGTRAAVEMTWQAASAAAAK